MISLVETGKNFFFLSLPLAQVFPFLILTLLFSALSTRHRPDLLFHLHKTTLKASIDRTEARSLLSIFEQVQIKITPH